METVKFGRTKVKIGDCVSVPNIYFGAEYLAAQQANGLGDELYRHVTGPEGEQLVCGQVGLGTGRNNNVT